MAMFNSLVGRSTYSRVSDEENTPKHKIMNTCKSPLKLSFTDGTYKVNKPYNQEGLYVDKQVADQLLAACEWAEAQFKRLADEGKYPEFMLATNGGCGIIPLINAIKLAYTEVNIENLNETE